MVTDTYIETQALANVQTSTPDYETDQKTRQRLEEWSVTAANLQFGHFTQMPDAVRHDATLSSKAKQVYEELLSYMWDKDFCFPSQETIAQRLHISRRTVIRACNELYKRCLIDKWRKGLGQTNYWFINPLSFVYPIGQPVTQIHLQRPTEAPLSPNSELSALYGITFYANDPIFPCKAEVTNCHGRSDKMAPPSVTNCHSMNTKVKETEERNIDSKFSSQGYKEEVLGELQPDAGTQNRSQETRPNPQPEAQEPAAAPPISRAQAQSDQAAAAISAETGIPASHLQELGVAPKPARRPVPAFIAGIMGDLTDALGDKAASRKGNITRATKYYYLMLDYCADDDFRYAPQDYFERLLYIAREEALGCENIHYRNGNRFNRMPAFFGCLEKRLGLMEEEREFVRTDGPLYYPTSTPSA